MFVRCVSMAHLILKKLCDGVLEDPEYRGDCELI